MIDGEDAGGVVLEFLVEAGDVFFVPEATGEELKFFGSRGRDGEILGVSPNDAKGIDEATKEDAGGIEHLKMRFAEESDIAHGTECGAGIGGFDFRMLPGVIHLEALDEVLDIDETSGAEFRVESSGGDELP